MPVDFARAYKFVAPAVEAGIEVAWVAADTDTSQPWRSSTQLVEQHTRWLDWRHSRRLDISESEAAAARRLLVVKLAGQLEEPSWPRAELAAVAAEYKRELAELASRLEHELDPSLADGKTGDRARLAVESR